MKCMINIENPNAKSSIEPMADAILRILEARADQKTIRQALRTFKNATQIRNLSFNDVHLVAGDYHEADCGPDADPEVAE